MTRWRVLIITLIVISIGSIALSAGLQTLPRLTRPGLGGVWVEHERFNFFEQPWQNSLATRLAALFAVSGCSVGALAVMPRRIDTMQRLLTARPRQLPRLALAGLLALLGMVITAGVASFAMLTFPLAVLLMGVVLYLSYAGFTALAYTFGRSLLGRAGWGHLSPPASVLLGVLILASLAGLPYIGNLLKVLYACVGIGVMIATRLGTGEPWDYRPLQSEEPQQ